MDYLYFILLLGLIIGLYFIGKSLFEYKRRETIIKNFESYIAVFQFYMDKAYNMIHKDQILIYSVEATTLPDAEFDKACKDFIQLVEKLMGPRLIQEMIFLYGDYETFLFNCMEYFNSRYDEDEIRKASVNEMFEKDDEPLEIV